MMAAKIDR